MCQGAFAVNAKTHQVSDTMGDFNIDFTHFSVKIVTMLRRKILNVAIDMRTTK